MTPLIIRRLRNCRFTGASATSVGVPMYTIHGTSRAVANPASRATPSSASSSRLPSRLARAWRMALVPISVSPIQISGFSERARTIPCGSNSVVTVPSGNVVPRPSTSRNSLSRMEADTTPVTRPPASTTACVNTMVNSRLPRDKKGPSTAQPRLVSVSRKNCQLPILSVARSSTGIRLPMLLPCGVHTASSLMNLGRPSFNVRRN